MSSNAALDHLYKDIILEHSKDPRNFGSLENPDIVQEGFNPLCGDRVVLSLKLDSQKCRVLDCRFKGEGCSICMASSSILMEETEGRPIQEVRKLIERFRELMRGERDSKELCDEESDVEALAGVRKFPVRIKCALLGWTTLQQALEELEDK